MTVSTMRALVLAVFTVVALVLAAGASPAQEGAHSDVSQDPAPDDPSLDSATGEVATADSTAPDDISSAPGETTTTVDREPTSDAPYVSGELLVKYESGACCASLGLGERVVKEMPEIDSAVLAFPEVQKINDRDSRESALEDKRKRVEASPNISAADYNYAGSDASAPNDMYYAEWQYDLAVTQFPEAWDAAKTWADSKGVTNGIGAPVAVIDSGIDEGHADLRGILQAEHDFVDDDADADDDAGHGTQVAGVIAANTNNVEGIAGACPDCKILAAKAGEAVRAADGTIVRNPDGTAKVSYTAGDMAEATNWAVDNGAKVINLSIQADEGAEVVAAALARAIESGVVVVACSGNYHSGETPSSRVIYPAAYPGVVGVGATDKDDPATTIDETRTRAEFSIYGPHVDVSAPGTRVPTTMPRNATYPYGWYLAEDGTSFAAPQVAALAGILVGMGDDRATVEKRIKNQAVDLGPKKRDCHRKHNGHKTCKRVPKFDQFHGAGRIDALATVRAAAND